MKRILSVLLVALFAVSAYAENMMHLLQGGYDAKVMTVAEMDSVLGERAPQNATSVFGDPARARGSCFCSAVFRAFNL